jgi:K+-transporting ATPase c subunit
MKKNLWISMAMTVVTTVVFGLLYPMIVTGLAQVISPIKRSADRQGHRL